jgi:hypothetical protein
VGFICTDVGDVIVPVLFFVGLVTGAVVVVVRMIGVEVGCSAGEGGNEKGWLGVVGVMNPDADVGPLKTEPWFECDSSTECVAVVKDGGGGFLGKFATHLAVAWSLTTPS